MSLLSDLLSKIKHPKLSKEVPPGLKSTVSALKKKESNRRQLAIVMILAVVIISVGFATVYITEVYLKREAGQIVSQRGTAIKQKNQRVQPSQRVLNEKPHQAPLSEKQEKTIETAKTRQPEKKPEEKNIYGKTRSVVEPQKKSPLEKSVVEAIQDSKFKDSDEVDKTMKAEKPKPDTSEKDIYLYMAKDYEAKGDYLNALVSYKKVLGIEPGNYRVINNIASILIRLNYYGEARGYLEKALSIRNDYVPGLINMGIVLAKLGQTQDAESYLRRAITLEPHNRQALFNIAIFYEKTGSYDNAREYYSRLKQLGDQQGGLGLERIKTATSNN